MVVDPRGHLSFIESGNHIPFEIARVFYIYNAPVDSERGGHAHKLLRQFLVPLSGSLRITLDDGRRRESLTLRDPSRGLLIEKMVWNDIDQFSQGTVYMVLASHPYEEGDYYRDYELFREAARGEA